MFVGHLYVLGEMPACLDLSPIFFFLIELHELFVYFGD